MNSRLLEELCSAQKLVTALCDDLDEDSYRAQFHPELSPTGWHLGHCAYTESYWLQEVVQGDDRVTAPLRELYSPPLTPKVERGKKIPAPKTMKHWVLEQQLLNLQTLRAAADGVRAHPLMQEDYLLRFLIQHYAQHYESMLMALTQRSLTLDANDYPVKNTLCAREPLTDTCNVEAGQYRIGGTAPLAYDNELPAQQAALDPYRIAKQPVLNAEYLAFIEAGGYTRQNLWSDDGWRWLQEKKVSAPNHWRKNTAGDWYGVGVHGGHELLGEDVLHGISQHEARAYADWAGGHLPHEQQWEVACRLHQLQDSGRAWEWCDNPFYPYEGFTPFPYKEYSQAWFDKRHYTLRGGSLHTRAVLKRASFRNFYTADKRHIFAGLRLVYPA